MKVILEAEARPVTLFLLAVLVYLMPTVWRLTLSEPTQTREITALETSQNVWQTPTLEGAPRRTAFPMMIWMNTLAWEGLDPTTAQPADMTARARCLGVLLGLVGVLSTGWIGARLYSARVGGLSALILASTAVVVQEARLVTLDLHLFGWITLAVAASFAFARDKPGLEMWTAAVLAVVASVCGLMTDGVVGLMMFLPPLLMIAVLTDPVTVSRPNLFTPFLLGVTVALIWLVVVLTSGLEETGLGMDKASRSPLGLMPFLMEWARVGLVLPWICLLVGLVPGLRRASIRESAPWLIVGVVSILCLAFTRREGVLLPMLPWFAVGFAHFWRTRKPAAQPVRLGMLGHLCLIALLTAAVPLAKLVPQIDPSWFPLFQAGDSSWVAVGALLCWSVLMFMGMVQSVREHQGKGLVFLTAVWTAGLMTFLHHSI